MPRFISCELPLLGIHRPTSITVSKLNAVPFHSINSPVCPPVNKRLPSGVHLTTVIGFFDFPIDWCKCRTGIVFTGECTRAMGGSICDSKMIRTASRPTVLDIHLHPPYSWRSASLSPSDSRPCISVADGASIVPLRNHNR